MNLDFHSNFVICYEFELKIELKLRSTLLDIGSRARWPSFTVVLRPRHTPARRVLSLDHREPPPHDELRFHGESLIFTAGFLEEGPSTSGKRVFSIGW
jgi:hypothetical protein